MLISFVKSINGADIGMVQRGCCLGFPLEPGANAGIVFQATGEKLERDDAVQFQIAGFVNDTHPAFAKFFDNFVMEDGFAGQLYHQFF